MPDLAAVDAFPLWWGLVALGVAYEAQRDLRRLAATFSVR